jgi:hypothetical protein
LSAITVGDGAEIVCCGPVIRTVPTVDLERTLTETELTLDFVSEICPRCGRANVISGVLGHYGVHVLRVRTRREAVR